MTILILVRHAVTEATGDRLGGWTPDVHLSAEGEEQAEATAERLGDAPVAAVYSSPLDRTRETAEIIAAVLGEPVRIDEGLGEVDYGDWTDEPLDDLRERDLWPAIQHTPSRVAFPGGETIRGAQSRVVDALEALVAEHPDEVVVAVSHADIIKAATAHLVGMPLDTFQRLVVSPASVTVLALDGAGPPRLLRFNDTGPIRVPDPADDDGDGGGEEADDG